MIKGVRPDQQLVKFVSDELLELMGTEMAPLEVAPRGPTVILMAGLQGVGKTTACGKLALFLKKQNKSVMMIATDTYRPAAIDQLKQLGDRVGECTAPPRDRNPPLRPGPHQRTYPASLLGRTVPDPASMTHLVWVIESTDKPFGH